MTSTTTYKSIFLTSKASLSSTKAIRIEIENIFKGEKEVNSKEIWKRWKVAWYEVRETLTYIVFENAKKGNNPSAEFII